jgi:hypothetical protein
LDQRRHCIGQHGPFPDVVHTLQWITAQLGRLAGEEDRLVRHLALNWGN